MTVTNVVANQATFTVDGVDYACQMTAYAHAWSDADGEKVFTACPDGVTVIPDPNADGVATGTASLLADWSAAGWAFALSAKHGTIVPCVVTLDVDQPTQARTYTGTVRVPRIPEEWIARQTQRADLVLSWQTCAGPTRYTAP
jgi:hypothetical protein